MSLSQEVSSPAFKAGMVLMVFQSIVNNVGLFSTLKRNPVQISLDQHLQKHPQTGSLSVVEHGCLNTLKNKEGMLRMNKSNYQLHVHQTL